MEHRSRKAEIQEPPPVDQKVLEAQQWVNNNYGTRPGYVRCPENGKTGWGTMQALTSALQAELGITPVNGSFGPATMAALVRHGDIGSAEQDKNLVRILKHALFCKGYNGGAAEGGFDDGMRQGLAKMRAQAGLGPFKHGVPPKTAKALLNMDAYKLLAGGTVVIQNIQRWLNHSYQEHANFFIIPCDGLYSRDVQQALMKALQYGFGLPDEAANGLFGEATKAGLRKNILVKGAQGRFVQLFSAACVFNGRARYRTQNGTWGYREAPFTGTFDDSLVDYVRAFQEFSTLSVTGVGDYATWAQLLVSFGDGDRQTFACDTSEPLTKVRAEALAAAGYGIVGRYLQNVPGGRNKMIQPGELGHIFGAGMRVVPIWQYGARDLADFTHAEGVKHAELAHKSAEGHGFRRGTVLYFAVDYDATAEEISSNIVPYFHGVQSRLAALGRRYVAGVYGSRNVCARVSREAFTAWSFVSGMSYRFSGNLGYPLPENWALNQIKEFRFQAGDGSFALDNDVHQPGADAGADAVGSGVEPLKDYLDYIDRVYRAAQTFPEGGDLGHLVLTYLRYPRYASLAWMELAGPIPQGWIAHADKLAGRRVTQYRDPSLGVTIDVDHFGATASGVRGNANISLRRADFSGWAGDLASLYGEWRAASNSYPSGHAFCRDRLARPDVDSTFSFNDLIEDVDGHLIGLRTRAGTPVNMAIREHLAEGGPHITRFTRFVKERYGTSPDGIVNAARTALTDGSDVLVTALRTAVITTAAGGPVLLPSALPADRLDSFLRGYAEKLQALAQPESTA
ncbi:DUF1906 domain-containing protein [Actinomadura sp. DSM 109109]|nr:DUF1906 domain-containing protein [Actinomadura lepetitiana]